MTVLRSNAPLAEMALAVQFSERQGFSAAAALEIYSAVRSELPDIELMERMGVFGAQPEPTLVMGEHVQPRWWFSTPRGDFLLQVQDDMVSLNWRRGPMTEANPPAYPGFDEMLKRFGQYLELWGKFCGLDLQKLSVSGVSISYDNIWPINSDTTFGDMFSFWNTMGIGGRIRGPQIRLELGIDEPVLGNNAWVTCDLSAGTMTTPSGNSRAARFMLSALSHPVDLKDTMAAFPVMHSHIENLLEKMTTEKLRESWNV